MTIQCVAIHFLISQVFKIIINLWNIQSVEINHNSNWPFITDHLYRILIIGGLGSRNTNVLLNLIKYQKPDIDKIYLYVKDPFESKY